MSDTIFAVSSGAPPAAIAIIRVSGPQAFAAGVALAGTLPSPRCAGLRTLRGSDRAALDHALVLAFPGPATATGEDLLELHCHGGRAIVRAVEAVLAAQAGLRPATPGEFTRRALANGRIDLAQAEGLADLIAAETEDARRAALTSADGAVSRAVSTWQAALLSLAARTEALLDFAEEDDVAASPAAVDQLLTDIARCAAGLAAAAARPPVERLRDGVRVVLAGPPNSGKSSLLNALAEREVAIATPIPGTTRDRLEVPIVRGGRAYILIDVAGLREGTDDPVEAIGIARAREAIGIGDIVLWLGDDQPPSPAMIPLHARADQPGRVGAPDRLAVSAATGAGLLALWEALGSLADELSPKSDEVAFNRRQLAALRQAADAIAPDGSADLVLIAEQLRQSRQMLTTIISADRVEQLLDALFSRFCVGK